MDHLDPFAVELEPVMKGEGAEVEPLVIREQLRRSPASLHGEAVERERRAAVLSAAHGVVMISADHGGGVFANPSDGRVRSGAVVHDVAETEQPIRVGFGSNHGPERVDVAMDVGNDKDSHSPYVATGMSPCSRSALSTIPTNRPALSVTASTFWPSRSIRPIA